MPTHGPGGSVVIPDVPLPPTPRRSGIIETPVLMSAGRTFCHDLTEAARRTASTYMFVAWITGVLGSLMVVVGQTIHPCTNCVLRELGLVVSFIGGMVVAFAYYCFSRADAASKAAATANAGLGTRTPEEAYLIALQAKSVWLASRIDSNAVAIKMLKELEAKQLNEARGPPKTDATDGEMNSPEPSREQSLPPAAQSAHPPTSK
jgi:hypothetical protein